MKITRGYAALAALLAAGTISIAVAKGPQVKVEILHKGKSITIPCAALDGHEGHAMREWLENGDLDAMEELRSILRASRKCQ